MSSDHAASRQRRFSEWNRNPCAVFVDLHQSCCRLFCCSCTSSLSTLVRSTDHHNQRIKLSFFGAPVGLSATLQLLFRQQGASSVAQVVISEWPVNHSEPIC